ncbi:phosphotriesterase-related protein [Amycolatopsis tolypomycina]|uniref:Phosphotriesterase-related protein n=1 Tax=Amycolatopsis tolypomycina TaxID=208445 RepID=A0A1H4V738_9PSEU|nr:phosphotriesterase [Amycolatopsis tolypomycina]SEC76899.1 phosphotriesterase-related protein [Amycolatopsis tolypomycina]
MTGDPEIRTVLGDIDPAELGVTNAHDHLFFASALLPGQELDDPAAAAAALSRFREAGGTALVQWTPHGLGRRMCELARISRETGVHLVGATGLHRAEHYAPAALSRVADDLAGVFVEDLTGTTGPRAGLVKVAGAFHTIDSHARLTMTAAAVAHEETGAPIAVHLELGTAGLETVELLCGKLDVPPEKVILGHLNRNPDPAIQREIAETGVFLGFDGPSRANHATDWRLFDGLEALVEAGHGGQLLLGGDTTTAAARHQPGAAYLLTTLAPRLTKQLGGDVVTAMLVANPARAFATSWLK